MSHLNSKVFLLLPFILCFLYSPQIRAQENTGSKNDIFNTLFLTANTGLSSRTDILEAIARDSRDEISPSLLLLGNITTARGFYSEGPERKKAEEFLRKDLLIPLEKFAGKVIFIPGVNEWKGDAPQSIDDLEKFLQRTGRQEFWPNDGCPLESESLGENLVIISVDSQWFLENWDRYPNMNNKCELNTREKFFIEFKDSLKDNQGKTIIVAIHHPIMTNSSFSFFDRVSGLTPQSFEHYKYKELRGRLETLASQFEDVIFVSGNDRNLQYLYNDRNPQIISGTAARTTPARSRRKGKFASEARGYAKLLIFKDGSSEVQFFEVKNGISNLIHSEIIERERPLPRKKGLQENRTYPDFVTASIYTEEETQKSDFYEWLWGRRYRQLYSLPIKAPVLLLDSLPGNVQPIAEGGGQQSRSLRLINEDKNEYVLRALRKDPLQYIQADLAKTSYIREFADSTVAERYIADFFTTAHPYAPFAVNGLSEAAGILHASPRIYYVPQQRALDIYNEEYGDALYMLEAHVGDENRNFDIFGTPDDIVSTQDLLEKLEESKDNFVDQKMYIRARLFDMLIGDWDRHEDQWRWAEFNEDGKKRYEPIPRDRDHAFSKYDGLMLAVLKSAVPQLRKMQSYDSNIKDLKWFNWSAYPLDIRLLTASEWNEWQEQVTFLQQEITDETIREAFKNLPEEVREKDLKKIKEALKGRRENLENIAKRYFEHLKQFQVLTGTNEKDHFLIERQASGITEISISQQDREIFKNKYNSAETNELWIYGLDAEDTFEIKGQGDELLELKILGGRDKDTYDFENVKKAKLYDYRSAENDIINPRSRKWLVDSYDLNHFNYLKKKYSVNTLYPSADFVPDAGFTLGVKDVYTTYGLSTNPFTTQYTLAANYFFASNGFDVHASAEFANVFYKWNFRLRGLYTGPNYYLNYFGTGNETTYNRSAVTKSFNRVKIKQWEVSPSLIWRNEAGGSFFINGLLESQEVKYEEGTFLAENYDPKNDIFDTQLYAGGELVFNYLNKNNPAFPSLGSELDLKAGYKQNIDEHNNQFGYFEPSFSVNYPLIPSGFAAIATKVGGEVILGDNYEFYHAATIGGNNSLRGYRNHRFNGQRSFYHSTDLRTALGLIRTKFIPLVVGVTAGFDYGRVWTDDRTSDKWHTDYGGSVWISAALAMTGNVGFYHGEDGNRLTFTLNFKY